MVKAAKAIAAAGPAPRPDTATEKKEEFYNQCHIAANLKKMKLVIILLEISNICTVCIEIHGDSVNIN